MDAVARIPPADNAYEHILDLLDTNDLAAGDRLPSERDMCLRWGVSRTAVRNAVALLVSVHRLERRAGSGTYVAPRRPASNCRGYEGFSDTVRAVGATPSSRVLYARDEVADDHTARRLGLAEGDPIFEMRRVRMADGQACMVETSYLNVALCPGIEAHDFARVSLLDVLWQEYGLRMPHGDVRLSVTRVDADEARLLDLPQDAPAFFQTGVAMTEDRVPVEYYKAIVRPDRYSYYAVTEHECADGAPREAERDA